MTRPTIRTEQLDRETVALINMICAEYGIQRSIYYEHSDLNLPGEGQISYMGLLAAMNGGTVTPEQEARIARSLAQVRQSFRREGRVPLARELPATLKAALLAYETDPDVFARGELSSLRRIIRRAAGRLPKK